MPAKTPGSSFLGSFFIVFATQGMCRDKFRQKDPKGIAQNMSIPDVLSFDTIRFIYLILYHKRCMHIKAVMITAKTYRYIWKQIENYSEKVNA